MSKGVQSISRAQERVSVLLLGSGWTSRFLLPALREAGISHAYTKRAPSSEDAATPFTYEPGKSDFSQLPKASMVAIVFPLTSKEVGEELISGYETATEHRPAWLALGSTGAWSKGTNITSSTPMIETNVRAMSEQHFLSLSSADSPKAVLNLSGLYGGDRNPVNFAKRVGETKEKLEGKTSLHLVHGKDVARAVIGMYKALDDQTEMNKMWGKRWIVTDTHVYDWWHLFTTLRPMPHPESQEWIKELTQKHNISELPRKIATSSEVENSPPRVLDRAMDGQSFWDALGAKPLVGRCDDYSDRGGGIHTDKEDRSRESL